MKPTWLLTAGLIVSFGWQFSQAAEPARFLRFQRDGREAYGLLEENRVREISGDLFGSWAKTQTAHALEGT